MFETIFIPGGYYTSKTKASKYLSIDKVTLQDHIKKGHLKTILFPDLGHLILGWDLLEFEENRKGPGRPTIYPKE